MAGGQSVAILGGGIFGCAIAWSLARRGIEDVTVFERGVVAGGSTSQAAALLTRLRPKDAHVQLATETRRALAALELELGEPLDVRRCGSVHVAGSAATEAALAAQVVQAERFGEPWEEFDSQSLDARLPWLDAGEVSRAVLFPDDAFLDPYLLATAYARAATARGVSFRTGVAVTAIEPGGERGVRIHTSEGPRDFARCVVAAGVWSDLLTAPLGVRLPYAPVRSQYWITTVDERFPADMPFVILPDASAYARSECGALLFGLRDSESPTVGPASLPMQQVDRLAWPHDPEGVETLVEQGPALQRFLPALDELNLAYHVSGPSAYTVDGEFAFGPLDGVPNLFVAAGCNGAGIALSGGVGRLLAELVAGAEPFVDPASWRPDRAPDANPSDPEFRRRCALARSRKTSG